MECMSFIRITEEQEIVVGYCYVHEFCVLTARSLLNLSDYCVHQVSELHMLLSNIISPFEFWALE